MQITFQYYYRNNNSLALENHLKISQDHSESLDCVNHCLIVSSATSVVIWHMIDA